MNALEALQSIKTPNVLVIGDAMLDCYIWCDADRVSPEAPVMVLREDRVETRLGGAANVVAMLAALGARVQFACVTGADGAGAELQKLLEELGPNVTVASFVDDRKTTFKTRFIGKAQNIHGQQVLRVDQESTHPLSPTNYRDLLAWVDRIVRINEIDVALVSDYGKGVCNTGLLDTLIVLCKQRGKRVIVDPARGADYAEKYAGCSTITPNRHEAAQETGVPTGTIAECRLAAVLLQDMCQLELGIVTADRDGIITSSNQGDVKEHYPVRERKVYDITGAGDAVLATLGLAIGGGLGYGHALEIANAAGGIEVERFGTSTFTRTELAVDLAWAPVTAVPRRKIVSAGELSEALNFCRAERQRIVFTNGVFDLAVHAGHVRCLEQAKLHGDVLVVGVNSDESARSLDKGGGRPFVSLRDRMAVLAGLACVDYVCSFDQSIPLELIRLVRPTVLVKGGDRDRSAIVGADFVESIGGKVVIIPLVEGISTTELVRRVVAAHNEDFDSPLED